MPRLRCSVTRALPSEPRKLWLRHEADEIVAELRADVEPQRCLLRWAQPETEVILSAKGRNDAERVE